MPFLLLCTSPPYLDGTFASSTSLVASQFYCTVAPCN